MTQKGSLPLSGKIDFQFNEALLSTVAKGLIPETIIEAIISFPDQPEKTPKKISVTVNDVTTPGMVFNMYESMNKEILKNYMQVAHVMSAHRKAWLMEHGMFNESYKASGDYDFILRARGTMRAIESRKILAYIEDGGVSRNSAFPLFETYNLKVRNGVGRFSAILWLARGLTSHLARRLHQIVTR